MKRRVHKAYRLYVQRDGQMLEYSATDFPSVADARVGARRLGEYAEIRRVETVTTISLVERVEHVAA